MPLARQTAFATLAVIVLAGTAAFAQEPPRDIRATKGVELPSPSVTETSDALAISVNPANLSLLDSWSFVYAGAWLKDQEHLAGQGHGFFFGFPIGPFALGLGLEALTPPRAVMDWQGLDDRGRFSLAVAFHFQRVVALGLAYRTFFRYDRGDIDTLDLALTVHPVNQLALSFVVSDVNAPAYGAAPLDDDGTRIHLYRNAPRRFDVGLTLRPFGNDRLALGGELVYVYGDELRRTDAGAFLSAMIIDGVTLRGGFGAEGIRDEDYDTGYFASGSVAIDLQGFGVEAGMLGQVSPKGAKGYQATSWAVRFFGDEGPALTLPRAIRAAHAVVVKIEDKLDSYGMTELDELFERIERDRSVDIAVIRPDPETLSLSQALEVRRAILSLRASGRQAICYLTDATGTVYLACAAADKVWINPAGGVRFAGLSTHQLYFRDLLDKIGVSADIVRIGEYKSGPEMFTRNDPSPASVVQMERYLDSVYEHLVTNVAEDRGLRDAEATKTVIEQGPFTAKEALANRLVDAIVPDDTLGEELKAFAGGPVYLDDNYGEARLRHRRYIDSPAVAVVHIDGDLIDGESFAVPFLGIRMTGAKTMVETLRELREDRKVQAVVLRIDSPGGSALASDIIWREVAALAKEKPVIASLGSVAASGGYYIASAANEIFAEPTTLTGSIGIYYGKADLSRLLDKIGVDVATFKRGAHADAQSWTRPYSPEERQRLGRQIGEYYDLFRERVAAGRGRGFTPEIVDRLGRGRIWSGADARYHLLVDSTAGYAAALHRARELGRVPEDVRVFHLPGPDRSLLKRLIRGFMALVRDPDPLEMLIGATSIKRLVGAAAPFAMADPGAPQARLPFAVVEE